MLALHVRASCEWDDPMGDAERGHNPSVSHGRARIALLTAAAAFMASLHGSACANVIEIGDDGAVRALTGDGGASPSIPVGSADRAGAEAITLVGPVAAPAQYGAIVDAAARVNGISPELLAAVVWQESRWRREAVSPAGAIGLSQLMPATARAMGVDPHDPAANLFGSAKFLRLQLDRFDGDVERALAAYNAGPERVRIAGGIPAIAETRDYVASVLAHLSILVSKDSARVHR